MSNTECPECDETVPIEDLCCGKCVAKAVKRQNEAAYELAAMRMEREAYALVRIDALESQLRAANKHCEIAVDGRDKARAREDGLRRLLTDISQTIGDELCDCGYYVSPGMKQHSDSCLKLRADTEAGT